MCKRPINGFWLCIAVLIVLLPTIIAGCVAAKSDQKVDQTPTQVTPTKSDTEQATQGAMVTVTQNNNLDGNVPRNKGTTSQPAYDAEDVAMSAEKTRMGFKGAHGDTWNIQFVDARIGGTDVAGTSTATGTSTQTPGQNGTQTQHTEPKTSASIPITAAVAPGSNASGNASTALEGTSTATKSDTIDQRTVLAQLAAGQTKLAEGLTALARVVEAQMAQKPTSQPAKSEEMELIPAPEPVFAPGTP